MTAAPADTPAARGLVGWAFYDFANSSFSAIIQTFVFAAYFTGAVVGDEARGTTLWGYTVGAAGLAVALTGPILGATADQGGRRKPWIAAFSLLCILCTAGLWFVTPEPSAIALAMALVALATFGNEAAVIFYNAMLPGLAPAERVGRWSGWGWALGYAGGVLSLILALLVFVLPDEPPFGLRPEAFEHVRATFPLTAIWFAVFALPLLLLTPDTRGTGKRLPAAVRDGFRQIRDSVRHVRRYRHVVRFLIAKMLYIDGLTTIFAFGGVYAAGQFGFTTREILLFGIGLNVTGAAGAAALSFLDDRAGSRATILVSLLGLIATAGGVLIVESRALFWAAGLAMGLFVGPVQAASRSYLARAAPPDLRNEFFGLYALSGKATAFLGPLLVAQATALSGSQRLGMTTILLFLLAGLALLLTVPRPEAATPTAGPRA